MSIPSESKEFIDSQKWRENSKKQTLNVSNCISSWTDICGFGNLLEKNNWDLNKLQNAGIVMLLNEVYTIVGRPFLVNRDPLPHDKVIVLNDGVARTVDLTNKEKLIPYIFLKGFNFFSLFSIKYYKSLQSRCQNNSGWWRKNTIFPNFHNRTFYIKL